MTSFISYVSNNYPSLKKDLENNLSNVSRELLKEAIGNFAELHGNEKIAKYQKVMTGQGGE